MCVEWVESDSLAQEMTNWIDMGRRKAGLTPDDGERPVHRASPVSLQHQVGERE